MITQNENSTQKFFVVKSKKIKAKEYEHFFVEQKKDENGKIIEGEKGNQFEGILKKVSIEKKIFEKERIITFKINFEGETLTGIINSATVSLLLFLPSIIKKNVKIKIGFKKDEKTGRKYYTFFISQENFFLKAFKNYSDIPKDFDDKFIFLNDLVSVVNNKINNF